MSSPARKASLMARHQDLDTRLQAELKTPRPDDLVVKGLKREKLMVKDALSHMS